ncbi:MAG: hypothetical protein E3J78_05645 [Candidatus Cloacimonadota bacterium]|nr:MAG: hypothetical protein E3J78_05645 [Candidatus Cloacimonadota bacterium]
MKQRFVVLSVIVGFTLLFVIQRSIDEGRGRAALLEELLYFPSGRFIEQVSIGYNEVSADLVWFRTIQYFGEHHMTDYEFTYLYHILDILTTLDKKFLHAYTFGALLLEHSAREPEHVDLLLHKGEYHNPLRWEIPFIRGFIYYVFRGDKRKATLFFLRASGKPQAPDMCKRFAGFTFQKMGDAYMAFKLWQDIYENSNNSFERETALRSMKEMAMLIQRDSLNVALQRFVDKRGIVPGSLKEMVDGGFIADYPEHPFEDEYFYIDRENERIWCSYLDRVHSPILERMLEMNDSSRGTPINDN